MDQRLIYGAEVDAVNRWRLDYDDRTVLACIQVASAREVFVAIRVRNVRARSRADNEFGLTRLGSDIWRVEHGVYDAHMPAPHPMLPAMSLLLTNAPESVSLMLARL